MQIAQIMQIGKFYSFKWGELSTAPYLVFTVHIFSPAHLTYFTVAGLREKCLKY